MNPKVRVIKRGDQKSKEPELGRESSHQSTREITGTIKLWVSEFKDRRRTEERSANKLILTALH